MNPVTTGRTSRKPSSVGALRSTVSTGHKSFLWPCLSVPGADFVFRWLLHDYVVVVATVLHASSLHPVEEGAPSPGLE